VRRFAQDDDFASGFLVGGRSASALQRFGGSGVWCLRENYALPTKSLRDD
jgi:hypothetical protein